MADQRNENNKPSNNKPEAGKISAGTSVGNVGESPMPHAQDERKSTQSSTLASHTSKPMGGSSQHNPSQARQGPVERVREGAEDAYGRVREGAGEAYGRVREGAEEAYGQASEWARDTYDRASSWANDTYEHRSERLGRAGRSVQNYAHQNPVMIGLVGLAAGMLIGALLPRTRRENRVFGGWADEVRQQGMRYAHDVTQRGREYVEDAFSGDDPRFSKHESEYHRQDSAPNRH